MSSTSPYPSRTHSVFFVSCNQLFPAFGPSWRSVSHSLPIVHHPPPPESHKEEATTQKKNPRGHARKHQSTTEENTQSSKGRHSRNSLLMFPSLSRVDIKCALPRNQNYTQASSEDKCLVAMSSAVYATRAKCY